jgi:hypothetical protein
VALLGLAFCHAAVAQEQPVPQPAPPAATRPGAQDRAAITAASAAERDRELKLLGITAMQPPATAYDVGKPGNANYDESKANPYPNLPPLLVMKDGTKVKTAAQWQKRRAEIKAMFAEDVYGKYPAHLPSVTWKVDSTEHMDVAGVSVIVKHIVGHTDNSAYPELTVDIHADVVTPASAAGKQVPIIIGGGSLRTATFRIPPPRAGAQPVHMLAMPENPPDSSKLLLEKGWGFVSRNLNEVQADNGAGLNKGIIGLVNHGQSRSLDDWGVLRAWAWADSRILDYLLTDHDVDAAKIGVTGHSRGGKEALLALADDTRFAIGYISSSGAGGADLYRRNYGETMGNLCGTSEFHWFAGNFMRYGAQGHTANELPVDSHELIALVAPRAIFIGGGALITDPKYAPGDAWQDAQGMFIAAAAASPAWQLLGAKGLGTTTFPPMNTLIDTGDVAFRQHQWGHTPAPNWPYFIEFAAKEFAKK